MAVATRRLRTRRRRLAASAGAGGPRYPGWLAIPAVAWYALFFLAPLAIMAVFSFSESRGFGGSDIAYVFDLENYRYLFDELYGRVFLRTLGLATFGTIVTLIVAFPFAYYLARYAKRKTLLLLLVVVPFWTSFLIRTYAWLIILDADFPVLRALRSIGVLPEDFRILFTREAIYIGVVYTYLPLMILPLYAALERIDWSLVDAALDLGDHPLRAFRRVTLRLALPGVIAGCLLVFIPLLGEYLNPVILGGDKTVFVGNLIAQQFLQARDWPLGSAVAMLVIAGMTVLVLVFARFAWREEPRG